MKKIRFSLVEIKLFRTVIVLVAVQLVIIFAFLYMLINSQPLNVNETKQASIHVDDIYYYRRAKTNNLLLVSDSKYYLITSPPTMKEHSVHYIYESISVGDRLSLTYYEGHSIILGQYNIVVDAHSETTIYRTLEEYNRGRENLPVFIVVLYSTIELMFGGAVSVYVWINYGTFKGVYRKIKKHDLNKKVHKIC